MTPVFLSVTVHSLQHVRDIPTLKLIPFAIGERRVILKLK